LAFDIRRISPEEHKKFGLEFAGGPNELDWMIRESDYLSLHLHLNPETRHIMDARRIGLMKSGASVINVARGALIDEEALYEALKNGRLGGAGLDVFETEPLSTDSRLWEMENGGQIRSWGAHGGGARAVVAWWASRSRGRSRRHTSAAR
jgi:phosphoglycerate dehydrogenase-like enzyme